MAMTLVCWYMAYLPRKLGIRDPIPSPIFPVYPLKLANSISIKRVSYPKLVVKFCPSKEKHLMLSNMY